MEIRKIEKQDYAAAVEMLKSFYASDAVSHNIPEETIRHNVDAALDENSGLEGYIFDVDGETAGIACVTEYYETEIGGICVMILDIYIKKEYRHRGIGTAFFKYVFGNYGYAKRFRLEVEEDNIPAVNAYKKQGFEYLEYKQMVINK